jgi:hypothetical protein
VTLKEFEIVDPAGTVMVAGIEATARLLVERLIVAPLGGAGANSVTVLLPAEATPPTRIVAARFHDVTASGFTVTVAVAVCPE